MARGLLDRRTITVQPEGPEQVFRDFYDATRPSDRKAFLVSADHEMIAIPEALFRVLREAASFMAQKRAFTVIPHDKELSTQDAADILNVSRPFLIKLLEQGQIPFRKVGTHRRIVFAELVNYKKKHDGATDKAIDEIARLSQEAGVYD